MRKTIILFLTMSMLVSCEKSNKIEEPKEMIDAYKAIKIGDDHETCYQKIQTLYNQGKLYDVMQVNNNLVGSYEVIEDRIKLYSTFTIIEKELEGKTDSVQFYFEEKQLKNISILNRKVDNEYI